MRSGSGTQAAGYSHLKAPPKIFSPELSAERLTWSRSPWEELSARQGPSGSCVCHVLLSEGLPRVKAEPLAEYRSFEITSYPPSPSTPSPIACLHLYINTFLIFQGSQRHGAALAQPRHTQRTVKVQLFLILPH